MPGIGLEVGFVVVWCFGFVVFLAPPLLRLRLVRCRLRMRLSGFFRRKRQQAVAPRKAKLCPSTSVKPPLQTNLNLPPYWDTVNKLR